MTRYPSDYITIKPLILKTDKKLSPKIKLIYLEQFKFQGQTITYESFLLNLFSVFLLPSDVCVCDTLPFASLMCLLEQDLVEPQTKLLQYVIAQPYSRDVICTMLGLNKQVCVVKSYSRAVSKLEKASSTRKVYVASHIPKNLVVF